jgi:hypothetical protein
MDHSTEPLDATLIAARAILGDRPLTEDYAYEIIGPSDNRTTDDDDAAERIRAFTFAIAAGDRVRERAPALAALSLLDLLDEVDWLKIVRVVQLAVAPRRGC